MGRGALAFTVFIVLMLPLVTGPSSRCSLLKAQLKVARRAGSGATGRRGGAAGRRLPLLLCFFVALLLGRLESPIKRRLSYLWQGRLSVIRRPTLLLVITWFLLTPIRNT